MNEFLKTINLDATAWFVVGVLLCIFLVGFLGTKGAGWFFRTLQRIHGVIAVYGPTEPIRRLAWDAVERLHRWNATRILLYESTRTDEDSAPAAAWVIAQEATPKSEVVLEVAENDPTLSDYTDAINAAKAESVKIRAHVA